VRLWNPKLRGFVSEWPQLFSNERTQLGAERRERKNGLHCCGAVNSDVGFSLEHCLMSLSELNQRWRTSWSPKSVGGLGVRKWEVYRLELKDPIKCPHIQWIFADWSKHNPNSVLYKVWEQWPTWLIALETGLDRRASNLCPAKQAIDITADYLVGAEPGEDD
jgi:hypothetical protein